MAAKDFEKSSKRKIVREQMINQINKLDLFELVVSDKGRLGSWRRALANISFHVLTYSWELQVCQCGSSSSMATVNATNNVVTDVLCVLITFFHYIHYVFL